MTASGQSETNVTTEPWSAVEWIADADLTRASFYWDSVPPCRNPPSACQVCGRAIPCSDGAKQRHDIIPNRLALTAEESVSGVTGATAQGQSGDPTHAHLHHWQRRNYPVPRASGHREQGRSCCYLTGGVACHPAQRQTPAGAVERASGCREAGEGR